MSFMKYDHETWPFYFQCHYNHNICIIHGTAIIAYLVSVHWFFYIFTWYSIILYNLWFFSSVTLHFPATLYWQSIYWVLYWITLSSFNSFTSCLAFCLQVTADGSIDCQDDPGEQEQIVSSLHYCEALAGILILSPGGHLVIKKFTMFESESVSLMYILCCLFEEVRIWNVCRSYNR